MWSAVLIFVKCEGKHAIGSTWSDPEASPVRMYLPRSEPLWPCLACHSDAQLLRCLGVQPEVESLAIHGVDNDSVDVSRFSERYEVVDNVLEH